MTITHTTPALLSSDAVTPDPKQSRRGFRIIPFFPLVAMLLCLDLPAQLRAQSENLPQDQSVDMGAATGFAIMGGTALTLGGSTITGDLGSQSGPVTGPVTLSGTNFTGNTPVMTAAQSALESAYEVAATRTPTVTYDGATDLGGLSLGPGVYHVSGAISMTSNLTLDAGNDPDAVWIFQTTAALNTTAGVSTLLANGALAYNVFWQVGGAVTMGAGTTFDGTIMAQQAITLGAGTELDGRALSEMAAVTLDGATINVAIDTMTLNDYGAVPEPSTYALFGLGALALVVAYRRRIA